MGRRLNQKYEKFRWRRLSSQRQGIFSRSQALLGNGDYPSKLCVDTFIIYRSLLCSERNCRQAGLALYLHQPS